MPLLFFCSSNETKQQSCRSLCVYAALKLSYDWQPVCVILVQYVNILSSHSNSSITYCEWLNLVVSLFVCSKNYYYVCWYENVWTYKKNQFKHQNETGRVHTLSWERERRARLTLRGKETEECMHGKKIKQTNGLKWVGLVLYSTRHVPVCIPRRYY